MQSSKSNAWAAVPLISAASAGAQKSFPPQTDASNCFDGEGWFWRSSAFAIRRAQGSCEPAMVTPTVSIIPIFAQCKDSLGKSSKDVLQILSAKKCASEPVVFIFSFTLDIELFDQLAPFCGFSLNMVAKLLWGVANCF